MRIFYTEKTTLGEIIMKTTRAQKRSSLKERAKNLENENAFLTAQIQKMEENAKVKGLILAMSVYPLNFDYLVDFMYQKNKRDKNDR